MEELSEDEVARFKGRLLDMKAELEELLHTSADDSAPVQLDQTSVGRLSRMDAMQVQAMAQETRRRRLQELQKVDAALDRIEDGEYGYCVQTGEPIPRARLDLDPAAATVVRRGGG